MKNRFHSIWFLENLEAFYTEYSPFQLPVLTLSQPLLSVYHRPQGRLQGHRRPGHPHRRRRALGRCRGRPQDQTAATTESALLRLLVCDYSKPSMPLF